MYVARLLCGLFVLDCLSRVFGAVALAAFPLMATLAAYVSSLPRLVGRQLRLSPPSLRP